MAGAERFLGGNKGGTGQLIATADLHELIDGLPENELPGVRRYPRYLNLVVRAEMSTPAAGEHAQRSRPSTGVDERIRPQKATDA